jgi:UDP-N-acetylmuramoylalanine--D-glutamate ligase
VDNKKDHRCIWCVDMMIEVDNMSDAVQMAQRLSEKGDTVLLSPACASFDLFEAMKIEENNLNKR